MLVEARLPGAALVLGQAVAGERDEPHAPIELLAYFHGDFVTVEPREPDVDERDVGLHFERDPHAGRAVFRFVHTMAAEDEQRLQHRARVGVVLDDEHVASALHRVRRDCDAFARGDLRQAYLELTAFTRAFAARCDAAAVQLDELLPGPAQLGTCVAQGVCILPSMFQKPMRFTTTVSAFFFGFALAAPAFAASSSDMDVKVRIVEEEVRTAVTFFVPVAQQRVWDVITDYERAPQYMRDVQSAKIVSRSGDTLRLAQRDQVKFGPFSIPIETVRDVKHVEPVRTESHLVSGSFKKYDAKLELVPEGAGTRIVYRSQTVPDSALAGFAGESAIRKHTEERFRQLRAEILRRDRVAATNASR